MPSGNSLDVLVWTVAEDCENGTLKISKDGLVINLQSGGTITSNSDSNIQYIIQNEKFGVNKRILFNPTFVVSRLYSPNVGQVVEGVFPPSTSGFYGRMRIGESEAIFIVQQIVDSSRFLLIIGNPQTGDIFDVLTIHPYEVEAIRMFDNYELERLWDESLWPDDVESVRKGVFGILDGQSISWTKVARLVDDVSISDLKLGKRMRETLNQLVPPTFPEHVRNELMAFLAVISKDVAIAEDPIDFYFRTSPLRMFGALIRGHLRCITDKQAWPPYVKLMFQASRGHLQPQIRPLDEHFKKAPWHLFLNRLYELFPSWLDIAINSANKLNESGKIVLRLPATKSRARKSLRLWKTRLSALTYGLRIQGHIDTSSMGLSEILYLGAAYRWPHRHMRFIARLGSLSENPQHLQIMSMPQSSMERVKRFLPSSMKISWSTRVVNLDLFDSGSKSCQIPIHHIVNSMTKQSSLKKLNNRFGSNEKVDAYQMSKVDAKVAGLISSGIFLTDFENQRYLDFWKISKKKFQTVLSNLVRRNIVKLAYDVVDARLVSVATIIQGNSKHVTALVEAFLKHTPTSLAFLNERSDRSVILSRLPEETTFDIASRLPEKGLQNELTIRCMRPMAFRSFTYNLYHRLLKDDGTWDDDVSAFLSQARSKRRELSESNA